MQTRNSAPLNLTDSVLGEVFASSSQAKLEVRIEQAIEPWLRHMAWRDDFTLWRKRRIWQENYQQANLKDVEGVLGSQFTGKWVLDLGSGMGGLAVALLREYAERDLNLQALDYNPAYAHISRLRAQRYGFTLAVAVGSGEQLPYPSAIFDLVLCLDVLEHVKNPGELLAEVSRVLKPRGVVLTTVPNRHAFRDPHYHLPFINWLPRRLAETIVRRAGRSKEGSLLSDRQSHSELNTYTWGEFRSLGRKCGFAVRDQVYSRISAGEIRHLTGPRRALLHLIRELGLLRALYRVYRYGWQGTYQIKLVKVD